MFRDIENNYPEMILQISQLDEYVNYVAANVNFIFKATFKIVTKNIKYKQDVCTDVTNSENNYFRHNI